MIAWIIFILCAVCASSLLFYRLYFLRKPKRDIPEDNTIISPADGKIVRILDIKGRKSTGLPKGLIGKVNLLTYDVADSCHVIVIMMTPLNVHYQRSPLSGTVQEVRYSEGKFINAVKDASSLAALENEKNGILIKNKAIGSLKVVQVAGFLARRIRCFVKKGQKIDKGGELGLICLGSQVILVLPKGKVRLVVKEGQRVTDGETVIARF
jgi:phosphatidylserine decarboxylase